MSSRLQSEAPSLRNVVPVIEPAEASRPALLLDRDGVLNVDSGYVGRYADFRWIPGAIETLIAFSEANWHICVVTNQSGIARGYFTEAEVEELHADIGRDAAGAGARINAFYYCPYHGEASVERYRLADHPDRKPNPGMLMRAMRDYNADIARSIMIGDKPSDLEAGHRAGVRSFLFTSGRLDDFLARCLAGSGLAHFGAAGAAGSR